MGAFNEYFIDTVRNRYAKFDGRARRSEFWFFGLFKWTFIFALVWAAEFCATSLDSKLLEVAISLSAVLFFIFLIIPDLALTVRRLHDTNNSGWLILVGIIPLFGPIVLLVFYLMEGTRGNNKYGPDPKAVSLPLIQDHLIERF